MPEVSVVIPTRNRWHFLEETLASALGQQHVDHEVVVVLDGSTDDTRDRLESITDERLSVIECAQRRGVAAARNEGMRSARGQWIAFLDDDDLWAPTKLSAQLHCAQLARADFVYAAAVVIDAGGHVLERENPLPDPAGLEGRLLAQNVLPAGASNVMVRRELVERVGDFDEGFRQLDDWDMWIRLARVGTPAAEPQTLVAVRQHAQNHCVMDDTHALLAESRRLEAKHRERSAVLGVGMNDVWVLHWIAAASNRRGDRRSEALMFLRAARRHPGNLLLAARAIAGRVSREPASSDAVATPAWLRSFQRDRPETMYYRRGPRAGGERAGTPPPVEPGAGTAF